MAVKKVPKCVEKSTPKIYKKFKYKKKKSRKKYLTFIKAIQI